MARVEVEIEETELENEDGINIDGIVASCGRCDHEVEVFGQGLKSIRRACIMLREECPNGEENYYVEGP